MGKYDTAGKNVIHHYNQAWVEWLLKAQEVKVQEELSGEFQFVARSNDSLLKVTGVSGTFLVLTELQFIFDSSMPERLAAYKLLARQKYKLDVFVTVIYFLPPKDEAEIISTYRNEFMQQITQVDFQVIKLWQLEAKQVLAHNNPTLLPFVPLMEGGNNEQVIRQCVERIRNEPESAELEAILAIFASYVLDVNLVKQIVRWEMPIVRESPIIQEMRQLWLTEGLEQGFTQGLEEGRQAMLGTFQQILLIRFNVTLEQFDPMIKRLDLDTLKKLSQIALTAPNITEFQLQLTSLLPVTKPTL